MRDSSFQEKIREAELAAMKGGCGRLSTLRGTAYTSNFLSASGRGISPLSYRTLFAPTPEILDISQTSWVHSTFKRQNLHCRAFSSSPIVRGHFDTDLIPPPMASVSSTETHPYLFFAQTSFKDLGLNETVLAMLKRDQKSQPTRIQALVGS